MVSHANAIADRVVSAAGPDSIRTIFAGGSLARGVVASVGTASGLEFYSDIDLYVVVTEEASPERVREQVASAMDETPAPPSVRFMRSHDAGVYTLSELVSQPQRPGTESLATSHLLLYGDASVFDAIAAHGRPPMAPAEGLYLIENRVTELARLVSGDGDDARRLLRFYRLKTVIDVAGACLVAAGAYRAGTTACVKRFVTLTGDLAGDDAEQRLVSRAGDALANLSAAVEADSPEVTPDSVVRFAIDTWHRIARTVYDRDANRAGRLIHKRCHIGDYTHNFRQFVAMQRRIGASRASAAWSGVHLTRFAPLDSLRVASLIECILLQPDVTPATREALASVGGFLDKLTAMCGYDSGTAGERARAMFQEVG